MKYNELTTPSELLDYISENISYGVYDSMNRCAYAQENAEFSSALINAWRLSSPKDMLTNKVGICYDYVELERDFFSTHDYKFKTFMIWFKCKRLNKYPTHTFLIYQDKNSKMWYRFEQADYANSGIHGYDTMLEAIDAQVKDFVSFTKSIRKSKTDTSKIEVLEYKDIPYGVTFSEYIYNVATNGKVLQISTPSAIIIDS